MVITLVWWYGDDDGDSGGGLTLTFSVFNVVSLFSVNVSPDL